MSFTGLVPGRELDGSDPAKGFDHPGRQRPPAGPALRSGLGLPAQPNVGVGIRERQVGVPPESVARSWAAQSVCPSGSVNSPPTRTCARWSPLPSPASSPGSSGPRWWPRSDARALPVAQRAIGAASESNPPRRAGAPPQQIRSSPALRPASLLVRCHGRPDSEATTCEWLYCDFDSRTSSWRFSDPLRSGTSSMARSTTTGINTGRRVAASTPVSTPFVLTLGLRALRVDPGAPRLLKSNQAPHLWCVAPKRLSKGGRAGVDRPFHIIAGRVSTHWLFIGGPPSATSRRPNSWAVTCLEHGDPFARGSQGRRPIETSGARGQCLGGVCLAHWCRPPGTGDPHVERQSGRAGHRAEPRARCPT